VAIGDSDRNEPRALRNDLRNSKVQLEIRVD
jgi:hypothetical protein